jgi:hypothetical protein
MTPPKTGSEYGFEDSKVLEKNRKIKERKLVSPITL